MSVPGRTALGITALAASLGVAVAQPSKTLDQAYRGLTSGPLRYARLASLPPGTLLRAGKLSITRAQLQAEIRKTSPQVRAQLKGHEILVLEKMVTRDLLLAEARAWATRSGRDYAATHADQLIGDFLRAQAAQAKVTEAEAKSFYSNNKEMFGDAPYDAVSADLVAYLAQQKQQAAVQAQIVGLGRRHTLELDEAWTASQARTVLANPVDQARRAGKPALVDFGSKGCGPCDLLAPILDELKRTYAGRCQVIVVQVREHPMLASRYGIQSIPVQIFFDKNGAEMFRHTGFWPKDRLIAKLAELGVK